MNFKQKAVEALYKAAHLEPGPARTVIKECAELIEGLPDEEREDIPCAMPNYEAMYHEAQMQLHLSHEENLHKDRQIRDLTEHNSYLQGYMHAVERIFPKGGQ